MKYIVSIILAGIMFIAFLPASAQDQKISEWTGKLADGRTITEEDLSKIIKEHKEWIYSRGKRGKRADLSGANLKGVDLSEANLSQANLIKADLSEANLNKAHLFKTYLIKTKLIEANLNMASLTMAKLRGANLSEANLNWAWLRGANLSEAWLDKANLRGANLSEANLSKAKLEEADASFADFSYSLFEPDNIKEFIFLGAKGFSTITFDSFKAAVDLRKVAKESGLRNEERALTSALYKYRLKAALPFEQITLFILLGLTTDYGASPWRSFCVLAFFIVIFSFYYMIILIKHGEDGIWKIWIKKRVRTDLGKNKPTRLTPRGLAVLRVGFYFSVLSAFNIGWRELNVGNWIVRLQRREYIYRATGWTRTVSGIQSLLSVYLLALWALTYFGRPFE